MIEYKEIDTQFGKLTVPYEVKSYAEQVEQEIRKKYSLSQELAIQRQRDTKPQEFKEYFDYCELCKKEVKERIATKE